MNLKNQFRRRIQKNWSKWYWRHLTNTLLLQSWESTTSQSEEVISRKSWISLERTGMENSKILLTSLQWSRPSSWVTKRVEIQLTKRVYSKSGRRRFTKARAVSLRKKSRTFSLSSLISFSSTPIAAMAKERLSATLTITSNTRKSHIMTQKEEVSRE